MRLTGVSAIGACLSDSLPVVVGPPAGAVPLQGTVRAGGVRPLEDPVLPAGQPAEDLRLGGLGAAEAVVGLHPGQRVRVERRSEEHTSELQSRVDLVCRLLLEKKK